MYNSLFTRKEKNYTRKVVYKRCIVLLALGAKDSVAKSKFYIDTRQPLRAMYRKYISFSSTIIISSIYLTSVRTKGIIKSCPLLNVIRVCFLNSYLK